MKVHYFFNVSLDNGIKFLAKVNIEDVEQFKQWIQTVPNLVECQENSTGYKLIPRTRKQTKIGMARVAAGLTQREFAEQLGVALSQAQYWEHGQYKPKLQTVMRMAEILNVDWQTLVDD